jgi:hypothetical protein
MEKEAIKDVCALAILEVLRREYLECLQGRSCCQCRCCKEKVSKTTQVISKVSQGLRM